jgi:hypothetical protein
MHQLDLIHFFWSFFKSPFLDTNKHKREFERFRFDAAEISDIIYEEFPEPLKVI